MKEIRTETVKKEGFWERMTEFFEDGFQEDVTDITIMLRGPDGDQMIIYVYKSDETDGEIKATFVV